jgi:hypothetical protein
VHKVNKTISLAFLAPHLVKATIEGRLPHGMGVGPDFATCAPSGLAATRYSGSPRCTTVFEPVFTGAQIGYASR